MTSARSLAFSLLLCVCCDDEVREKAQDVGPPVVSLGRADIVIEGSGGYGYLAQELGHGGAVNGLTQGILLDAYRYEGLRREDYVYLYFDGFDAGQDAIGAADATAFLLEAEHPHGMSRTAFGDQNQDGFPEIVLWHSEDALLVFGPVTGSIGMTDVDVVLSNVNACCDYFQVESAGDVDGDGIADLLVGDPDSANSPDADAAYLYYGPVTASQELPAADVAIAGQDDASVGYEVARLGDVNADGYGDVLVSCYRYPISSHAVFHGPLIAGDSCDSAEANLELDIYGSVFSEEDRRFHGGGDLDGDGFDDLLIGQAGLPLLSDSGLEFEGAGGASLLLGPLTGVLGEDDVDVVIAGQHGRMQVGWDAAGLGDVDADGYDDLLLGAPDYWIDAGRDSDYYEHYGAGGAYLFLGPLGPGELTTDQADLFFKGADSGDVAGYRVAAAGDLDADGVSDFVVGAPSLDEPRDRPGAAYVVLGGEDLLERYAPQP